MEHFVPSQYTRNIFVLLSAYLFSYNLFFHVIRQIAHFRQVLLNKIGFIKNRDIWMKNKKKPFCEHAQRTDAYVTGEEKGFDAVIRQIVRFFKVG